MGGDYDQIGQCHLQLPYFKKGILEINIHKKYK